MKRSRRLILVSGGLLVVLVVVFRDPIQILINRWMGGPETVRSRLWQCGNVARGRLAGDFARAGIAYPPAAVALVAIKEERRLEVYASEDGKGFRFVREYPILGASGHLGPKLREGDRQVPEGLYAVENLNPNSLYHLALRVNYPNAFDLARAGEDGRAEPGSDIMIHGGDASVGCLAMGDEAAEDLFVLAAETGVENVRLVFSPVDFRVKEFAPPEGSATWVAGLYGEIRRELKKYPREGR